MVLSGLQPLSRDIRFSGHLCFIQYTKVSAGISSSVSLMMYMSYIDDGAYLFLLNILKTTRLVLSRMQAQGLIKLLSARKMLRADELLYQR